MQGSGVNLQYYGKSDPVKKSQEELSDALLFMPSHLTKTILYNSEHLHQQSSSPTGSHLSAEGGGGAEEEGGRKGRGRGGGRWRRPWGWIKGIFHRPPKYPMTEIHSSVLAPPYSLHPHSHTAHTELQWPSAAGGFKCEGGAQSSSNSKSSPLLKRPYHIKPPGEMLDSSDPLVLTTIN